MNNIIIYIKPQYIKTDDNKIINEQAIKWVKKIDECLHICTKSMGCFDEDTHKLCKIIGLEYETINLHK